MTVGAGLFGAGRLVGVIGLIALVAVSATAVAADDPADLAAVVSVADRISQATAADGSRISWVEHLVDGEDVNGGVAIRGGDGLVLADIDRDGREDIVSVHEDSHHLRIAFAGANPDQWISITVAHGRIVGAIEDVAVGDLNGDGWPDLVAACEEAHLAYFENPGAAVRTAAWSSLVPAVTQGRGSWLKVDMADFTGDGRLEVVAANKGVADVVRAEDLGREVHPTSLFYLRGDPLIDASWREEVLVRDGVPNQARAIDIDADGAVDLLAASRLDQRIFLVRNQRTEVAGDLSFAVLPVAIASATASKTRVVSNAFDVVTGDIDRDGRIDLVVNALEFSTGTNAGWQTAGVGWLAQPASLDEPWVFHRIGTILPDWTTGLGIADIDGDGDLDVMVGGYSGLNVLRGGYSGASRDEDDARVTATDTVARIAWFANPGDGRDDWTRHDISRRVRGMYDTFVPRDMDGDGDIDFVATRGNSGALDGVFWLEQQRSRVPAPAFRQAREQDSRALPLPPENWREHYGAAVQYVAPNKAAQEAALDRSDGRDEPARDAPASTRR